MKMGKGRKEAMKFNINKKMVLIASGIGLLVVLIIVVVFGIDNSNKVIKEVIQQSEQSSNTSSDIEELDQLIKDVNTSKIEIISNKNNEQADVILDSVGVDIKSLLSYAGSVDPREGALHTILILRPKEESYDEVRRNVTSYIATKQQNLMPKTDSGEETAEYKIAKSALLYEKDGYIVMVLGDKAVETMNNIIEGLDKIKLDMATSEENKGETNTSSVASTAAASSQTDTSSQSSN